MVSANESAFELFLEEQPLDDFEDFLKLLNKNLPPDIKALDIEEVDGKFNIIQHSKQKEYHYLFSFGEKNHPFCASLMTNIQEDLDLDLMKEGAKLFKGLHHFQNFCVRSSGNSIYEREVQFSEIKENTIYTANFFPEKSYVLIVKGSGFLRYQIRLMMGTLIQLGKGELSLEDITENLKAEVDNQMTYIAPASGLILHKIEFI